MQEDLNTMIKEWPIYIKRIQQIKRQLEKGGGGSSGSFEAGGDVKAIIKKEIKARLEVEVKTIIVEQTQDIKKILPMIQVLQSDISNVEDKT